MSGISSTLNSLLALSLRDETWRADKNRSEIRRGLEGLLQLSHEIPNGKNESNDPSLVILAPVLSDQIRLALSAHQLGQFEVSRQMVRSLTASCFGCHSREPEWSTQDQKSLPGFVSSLSALDQARYAVSLHQTKTALSGYERFLLEPGSIKRDLQSWHDALRESLTLILRVNRDPQSAIELIGRIKKIEGIPFFLKRELAAWERDLLSWRRDRSIPKGEALLRLEIQKRYAEASARRTHPLDHSADMAFLRLTSLLYEMMRRYPKSRFLAEAEYLQGVSYETLSTPPFENLHELFYESCIRREPHSRTAEKCYERLERSVYFGFTGSSGTHIPIELENKLLELWGRAFVPGKLDH